MTLQTLNNLPIYEAARALSKCCGATSWVNQMIKARPFLTKEDLFKKAERIWYSCQKEDWLEAFSHHPKIGDSASLEKKFAATKDWSGEEQKSVASADKETIQKLAKGNHDYEAKFGFIFIVCATGKSAAEMLSLLEARIGNNYADEIRIAMGEQHKITLIRLEKLLA